MKVENTPKQCPEVQCPLVKYFLTARGFNKRISYEKREDKEIIKLKNRFCEIELKNIFPYESEMDMPLIGDVKYIEPQHIYFEEKYKDESIKSFGVMSNEPINKKETYCHQEEYFDFRHVIKYNDKVLIISYRRPQYSRIYYSHLYRSQPCLQLSYYEDIRYTRNHYSDLSYLRDAFSESCSYYPWEEYRKSNYVIDYCHYYDEYAFAEIYREAEKLLGVKLGYRLDMVLKLLKDQKKLLQSFSNLTKHSRKKSQYEKSRRN